MIRVGYVPIVRPLFRGARMGLWEASRRTLADLAPRLGFELAYASEPATDGAQARACAAEARRADLDLLLVQHVTFATGDVVTPLLDVPVPLALWALPEATTAGPLPQNALCGLNLSMSLRRARPAPLVWLYGAPDDPVVQRRLDRLLRAARGWRALTRGRLLWIGGAAPGFFRFDQRPALSIRVDQAPLEAVFETLSRIPDDEVDARLAELAEPSDLPIETLRRSVRLELALAAFARGYDGVALRCWPELPDTAGTMACAAFAWLGDRGVPMACEGDASGLAAMVAMAAVTARPAVLLDLTHVQGEDLIFWHCGNAPRAWAAGETRLIAHFNRGVPAVRHMRLRPGPASGVRFLEEAQAVVYAGTVHAGRDGYDGVTGTVGDLRWGGTAISAREFVASVLNHRIPHHFAWGMGDVEDVLTELCAWLGLRVLPPSTEGLRR